MLGGTPGYTWAQYCKPFERGVLVAIIERNTLIFSWANTATANTYKLSRAFCT